MKWVVGLAILFCFCPPAGARGRAEGELDFLRDSEKVVGVYADRGADPYLREMARRMLAWMSYRTVDLSAGDLSSGRCNGADCLYFAGGSTGPYRSDIGRLPNRAARRRMTRAAHGQP